jgi:hypothetical protein
MVNVSSKITRDQRHNLDRRTRTPRSFITGLRTLAVAVLPARIICVCNEYLEACRAVFVVERPVVSRHRLLMIKTLNPKMRTCRG